MHACIRRGLRFNCRFEKEFYLKVTTLKICIYTTLLILFIEILFILLAVLLHYLYISFI